MRVGVVIMSVTRWREQARQWRAVEDLGFDHAWAYDHLTWDPYAGRPWGATIPTLVAAATVTSTIRLGTWVASPNYRHPVPFARELAALDDVSGGRAILGVGAGGTGSDARVLGDPVLPPAARAARLEEFVELLDRLLAAPPGTLTDYLGEHYRAARAETALACVQRPRLPFVIAANGPRLMRLAARLGAGWATTGATSALHGETDDEAWWRGVARLTERFGEVMEDAAGSGVRPSPGIDRLLSVDAAPTFSLTGREHFVDVAGRAADLGFTDIVVHWPVPGAPRYDAAEHVLEQVAAILPSLR